jgi:flagellar basal-body rod protein FlgG
LLEGMYTAAAGMAAQQTHLDAVANDLANVSTTGYKHVRVAFRDLLYASGGRAVDGSVKFGAGAAATDIGRSLAQGALQNTGQPLDVALQGNGFIAVRGRDGQPAMTRDGALRLDDRNRLVTDDGLLLDPPVTVPAGTDPKNIEISQTGAVAVGGRKIGALRLVTVPAPSQLEGGPDNTFKATRASGAVIAAPAGTTVAQGALEASNVDMGEAMTDMIDAQRSFQMASKAIQFADQMAEIANGVKK